MAKLRLSGTRIPKRERAKLRRRLNRKYGLNRRTLGAIGAGHAEAPEGYTAELDLGIRALRTIYFIAEQRRRARAESRWIRRGSR